MEEVEPKVASDSERMNSASQLSGSSSQRSELWDTTPKFNRRATQAKRRERIYLQQFGKYLDEKLAENMSQKAQPPTTQQSVKEQFGLGSQLNRRKLQENTTEFRIQRTMEYFKSLDTYVNVKEFIEKVNLANLPKEIAVKFHPRFQRNTLEIIPHDKGIPKESQELFRKVSQHIKPIIGRHLQNQLDDITNICTTLKGKHEVQAYANINTFLTQQAQPAMDSRQLHTQEQRDAHKFSRLLDQLDHPDIDQKYYEEFQSHIEAISKKMKTTLNSVYQKKWEKQSSKPKRRASVRIDLQGDRDQDKPILEEKYRLWAPRDKFRWRVGSEVLTESEMSLKSTKANLSKTKTAHTSPFCQRGVSPSSTLGPLIKRRHKPLVRKLSLKQLQHSKAEKSSPIMKSRATSKTLKQVNEHYRFRHPMIKQNLLRKVSQFINLTEKRQIQLRQGNSYITSLIGQVQSRKRLDFDRFHAQSMEVTLEDIKRFSRLKKKHSLI